MKKKKKKKEAPDIYCSYFFSSDHPYTEHAHAHTQLPSLLFSPTIAYMSHVLAFAHNNKDTTRKRRSTPLVFF